MKQDEIIEMARQAGFEEQFTRPQDAIVRKGIALSGEFKGYKVNNAALEAFAKLVAAKEREKIKHFLTATSVSVQSRVYVGDEEISMLKMTHEEIRARGEA
jgi:hypothetical protein